jgi:hypothetical protein
MLDAGAAIGFSGMRSIGVKGIERRDANSAADESGNIVVRRVPRRVRVPHLIRAAACEAQYGIDPDVLTHDALR